MILFYVDLSLFVWINLLTGVKCNKIFILIRIWYFGIVKSLHLHKKGSRIFCISVSKVDLYTRIIQTKWSQQHSNHFGNNDATSLTSFISNCSENIFISWHTLTLPIIYVFIDIVYYISLRKLILTISYNLVRFCHHHAHIDIAFIGKSCLVQRKNRMLLIISLNSA